MIPDPLLIRLLLVRGAGLWLGIRLMLAFVGVALYGHLGGAGGPMTGLLVAVLTAGLALVDQRRRREVDLFCNLGVSRSVVATLAAVPALAAEALIRLPL